MTRRRRATRREAAERRAARRKKRREENEERAIRHEIAAEKYLALSWEPTVELIEKIFSKKHKPSEEDLPQDLRSLIWFADSASTKGERKKFKALLIDAVRKAPKILDYEFLDPLSDLGKLPWIRPLKTWKPKGKSNNSIFRSLIDHLLVQYSVPNFLYSIFFMNYTIPVSYTCLYDLFVTVAKGGSLYRHAQTGRFPPVMTRKMCHYFLNIPHGTGIVEAVRHAQVLGCGGDRNLAHALHRTRLGRTFAENEKFWFNVIQWFCNRPMLKLCLVRPLVDYINHRADSNPAFSMKGRTVGALISGMEKWHGELALERKLKSTSFKRSGIGEGIWERSIRLSNGNRKSFIWTMEELLSSRELAVEGRAMKHCVYSYAEDVECGDSSIWSLRREGKRKLTVEVENRRKEIAEALGMLNRIPTAKEIEILELWAGENNLKMSLPDWYFE